MKCPHCSSPITTGQAACPGCGFSASAIRAYLGADWVRLERITDVAGRLNLRETRHLETVLDEFERSFPQCFLAGYIGVLPDTLTLTDLGFWLINHGAFQTHQVSRRNDFAIVLLIDPLRQQAGFTVGYALENVLTEPVLQAILKKLNRPLQRGAFGQAVEQCSKLVEKALRSSASREPRQPERPPAVVGDASDLGLQSLRPPTRQLTRPHAGQKP